MSDIAALQQHDKAGIGQEKAGDPACPSLVAKCTVDNDISIVIVYFTGASNLCDEVPRR